MIDLGEMSRDADRPAADRVRTRGEADPAGAADRRPPGRRPGAVVTALASAAILLAGSVPQGSPALAEAQVHAGLADDARVIGGQLYLIRPDLSIPRRAPRVVASYRLPDGQLLWQTSLEIRGALRQAVSLPSVTLVSIDRLDGVETVAVEIGTGQIRWRRPYLLVDVAPDRGLALAATAPPAITNRQRGSTLVALDVTTGQIRWQHSTPGETWQFLQQDWVVSTQPSGRVEVRDLEHGDLIAAADLRPAGPPALHSWVLPVPGQLLATTAQSTVAAYGLPWLDRRWQADWGPADWSAAADCGTGLCVFSRTDGLRLVDPATGRTRWSDSRWISAEPAANRLLVRGRQRPGRGSAAALLDPRTGRVLLDLGRWTAVSRPDGSRGTLLAAQIDGQRGLAWFTEVDPETLTAVVRDTANEMGTNCQPGPGSLICRRRGASVTIWRFARHP